MAFDSNNRNDNIERSRRSEDFLFWRQRLHKAHKGTEDLNSKERKTTVIVEYDFSSARIGLILLCIVPFVFLLHPILGWSLWICCLLALLANLIIAVKYVSQGELSVKKIDVSQDDFETEIEELYKDQNNFKRLSKILMTLAIILTTIPFFISLFCSSLFIGSSPYYVLFVLETIELIIIWYILHKEGTISDIHHDSLTGKYNEGLSNDTMNNGSVSITSTSTFSVDTSSKNPIFGILSLVYDESEDALKATVSWIKEIFKEIQIYDNPSSEEIIGRTDVALCLMGMKSGSAQVIDILTNFYNLNKRIVPVATDEHSGNYDFKFRIGKYIWEDEDSREKLCALVAGWQGMSFDSGCISGALVNVSEVENREVEVFVDNKKIGLMNQDFRLGTGTYNISCVLASNKFCIIDFKMDVDAAMRIKYNVTIDIGKYLDSLLQVEKSKLEWKGGQYFGQTYNGMPHGSGEYSVENSTYSGEWEFGSKSGQGKLTDLSGVYEGEWKDDKRHGFGKQIYNITHEEYVGEWKDDKRHGQGIICGKDYEVKCLWMDDMLYEAEASKIPFANGYFNGRIVKGKRQGMGTFTIDGKNINGMWVGDMPSGEMTVHYSNGLLYIGELDTLLLRNGYGKMYYRDGSQYDGYWSNDKREGYGTITTCAGKKSGKFRNGTYVG